MFDLIIKKGTIIDGRKTPRYQADIGIQDDRITAIGDLETAASNQTIDAQGQIVAPGFIDVHTHSDAWLLKEPHFWAKTSQGFTTEFLMLDGISYAPVNRHTIPEWIQYLRSLNGLRFEEYNGWESIADYMRLLDGNNVQNTATYIPYANVRTLACGFGQRFPDDYQLYEIKRLIEAGMGEGAMGISSGLDYVDEHLATTDELVAACRMMAPEQGVYVTHVRYLLGTLAGVKEAVEIGKRAGVPVHISHLKGTSPAEIEAILDYIDQVAIHEVDFSFDVYPYVPSSTMLQYLLPHEVWRDGPMAALNKLTDPGLRSIFERDLARTPLDDIHIAWVASKENSHHQGKRLGEYVAEVGKSPADALCELLIEENMAVLLVFHLGDDELVNPFLAHERYMMGSDGIYHPDGVLHPRQFGSAVRLLGPCVRDRKLFSLEEAVYKLSGYSAQRFGMKNRGHIREGNFADLVIFDADTVTDKATFDDPRQHAGGITAVLINGTPIITGGQPVPNLPHPLPGRYLRYNQ